VARPGLEVGLRSRPGEGGASPEKLTRGLRFGLRYEESRGEISSLGFMAIDESTFEQAVKAYYESLFRFAWSLTHREADASDLTQETYRRLAQKGHQIQNPSKLKSWLFTTLYRHFIDSRQEQARFEEYDNQADLQPASSVPPASDSIDGAAAREALLSLEEPFRTPLVLFYLEENSYQEIADILHVPIGTVMSRISRGREQLRARFGEPPSPVNGQAVSVDANPAPSSHESPGS
jgi:RNA polymerase sigma-70 factor, ECF subfamily